MAELNFGLLTPPGSENIANAFVRGQDQSRAAQMQDMQMQQATRKGQMDELTYKKALDTEARLNKYYANIAANGGPKTALEAENAMIGSGIPHIADMGAKAQLLRLTNESDLALFNAAKTGPTAAPAVAPMAPAVAPAVAPEPGSFGADVAERRAADPFAPAPDTRTNMMDGAAPTTATVNNLPAVATGAGGRTVADMVAERDRMALIPGKRAADRVKTLTADIALASRPPVYHNVPGVGLVDPTTNRVVTPSVEATAPNIREYEYAKKQGFAGSLLDYRASLARAGRALAQPPVEKPMTQAQRVTYAKDKVSDRDIVTGALAVTGELEKLTDELVGNPDKKIAPARGLNSITGYSALTNPLALPSGDARKALQKLETFRGKIMALGRQLASQEGKLGNMAVQEWKFVSDAVQKIDPAAGNLDEQMRDVVRQSREYARRQQAKYDDTYADDLTAPPAGAGKKSSGASGSWGKAVAE